MLNFYFKNCPIISDLTNAAKQILAYLAYLYIWKIKNKPRVKENAQQASSSRAAEIIATSGQAPIQNLGGFAQFLGGTAFSSTSTLAASDIDSAVSNATLDPELVLVLKRLSKRDPITKLKALEEFESYLKSKERNENELTGILDLWTKLFVKLEIDVDRRIRYATYSYVARVANESFQAALPPEKRVDVLVFDRKKYYLILQI
ncbi:unnamed protein product [Rhizophagus irregularis]|nr:unnamed protein product [Rhizophagus irregularis]CAB4443708.1 unnamed protein product [Rhizophagus irregularis]